MISPTSSRASSSVGESNSSRVASPRQAGPASTLALPDADQLVQRVRGALLDRGHPPVVRHRVGVDEPGRRGLLAQRHHRLGQPPVGGGQGARRSVPPGRDPRARPGRTGAAGSGGSTRASSGSPGAGPGPGRSRRRPRCRRSASRPGRRRLHRTTAKHSRYCARTGSRSSSPASPQDCQSAQISATAPGSSGAGSQRAGQQLGDPRRVGPVLDREQVAGVVPRRRGQQRGPARWPSADRRTRIPQAPALPPGSFVSIRLRDASMSPCRTRPEVVRRMRAPAVRGRRRGPGVLPRPDRRGPRPRRAARRAARRDGARPGVLPRGLPHLPDGGRGPGARAGSRRGCPTSASTPTCRR